MRRPPRRWRPWLALALWLLVAGAVWLVARGAEGGVTGWLERALARAARGGWALPALVAAYALRPLLLLPTTLITVFAGFLLGPWWGTLVAALGATASAAVPYLAARRLGGDAAPRGRLGRLAEGVRRNAFTAILSARLAMVPGDVVNVTAGAWRASVGAFVAATLLGGLPGLLMGVLAGAGLRGEGEFRFDGLELRPPFLIASGALLLTSLALAYLLRRVQGGEEE